MHESASVCMMHCACPALPKSQSDYVGDCLPSSCDSCRLELLRCSNSQKAACIVNFRQLCMCFRWSTLFARTGHIPEWARPTYLFIAVSLLWSSNYGVELFFGESRLLHESASCFGSYRRSKNHSRQRWDRGCIGWRAAEY
eukprot:1216778-Amphidinium_carterae.2